MFYFRFLWQWLPWFLCPCQGRKPLVVPDAGTRAELGEPDRDVMM